MGRPARSAATLQCSRPSTSSGRKRDVAGESRLVVRGCRCAPQRSPNSMAGVQWRQAERRADEQAGGQVRGRAGGRAGPCCSHGTWYRPGQLSVALQGCVPLPLHSPQHHAGHSRLPPSLLMDPPTCCTCRHPGHTRRDRGRVCRAQVRQSNVVARQQEGDHSAAPTACTACCSQAAVDRDASAHVKGPDALAKASRYRVGGGVLH